MALISPTIVVPSSASLDVQGANEGTIHRQPDSASKFVDASFPRVASMLEEFFVASGCTGASRVCVLCFCLHKS